MANRNTIQQIEQTSISHTCWIVKRKLLACHAYPLCLGVCECVHGRDEEKGRGIPSHIFVIQISVSFYHALPPSLFRSVFFSFPCWQTPSYLIWHIHIYTNTNTFKQNSSHSNANSSALPCLNFLIRLCVWVCFAFARHPVFLLLSGSLIVRVLISFDFLFFSSCHGYKIYDIYVCIIFFSLFGANKKCIDRLYVWWWWCASVYRVHW